MIRFTLLLFISCGSDIAIITSGKNTGDTSEIIAEDSSAPGPSTEPTDSMTELTIGFAEISLTQIACPACMGVSSEFDISANLKLHQPTNGGYNDQMTPIGTCVTQELG